MLKFFNKLFASASVLAIMFAISTHIPNYRIQIPFIGMIKIKYLAIALIILGRLTFFSSSNSFHSCLNPII